MASSGIQFELRSGVLTSGPDAVIIGVFWGWVDRYAGFCPSHRYRLKSGGHPSTNAVADALQRPTRTLRRAAFKRALSGLAPGGVYRAAPVTRRAGGLLHHLFTLTAAHCCVLQRSVFCGTFLRVTPSGRYPPPCSTEPGRSSVTRSPCARRGSRFNAAA